MRNEGKIARRFVEGTLKMAKKKAMKPRKKTKTQGNRGQSDVSEILTTLLITQLGLAGIPHQKIRAIVGGNMNRVTKNMRHLKVTKKK